MRGAVRRQGQGRGRGAEGEGEAEVSAQADSCGRGCPSPRGGGKRMTCDFLCLGHRNLVKVAPGAVSIPSCSSPPSCCMVGHPSAANCSQVLQRELKCGGSGVVPTAVELIYRVIGLHVC